MRGLGQLSHAEFFIGKENCAMTSKLHAVLDRTIPFVAFLCCLGFFSTTYAQQPDVRFRVYLTLKDSSGADKPSTVYVGVHTLASYCVDTSLTGFTDHWTESPLNKGVHSDSATEFPAYPPCPPTQELRARNISTTLCHELNSTALMSARPVNIHNFSDRLQVDTFRITWCKSIGVSSGTALQVFSWPPPPALQSYCDSMFFVTNTNIKVNMLTESRYVYDPASDPGETFSSARIYLYHPKLPPGHPATIVAIKPLNGDSAYPAYDSLVWNGVPNAYAYKVQLSQDRNFQSLVFHDSSTRTFVPLNGLLSPTTWYYWRVIAFSPFGVGYYKSPADSFQTETFNDVRHVDDGVPRAFALHQNYPNPFNPTTEIAFDIRNEGMAEIAVYTMLGQRVALLAKRELSPGAYSVTWNGTNDLGTALSGGVYIVRMTVRARGTDDFSAIRKIVLIK